MSHKMPMSSPSPIAWPLIAAMVATSMSASAFDDGVHTAAIVGARTVRRRPQTQCRCVRIAFKSPPAQNDLPPPVSTTALIRDRHWRATARRQIVAIFLRDGVAALAVQRTVATRRTLRTSAFWRTVSRSRRTNH